MAAFRSSSEQNSEKEIDVEEEKRRLVIFLRKKVFDIVEKFTEEVSQQELTHACNSILDQESFTNLAEERSLVWLCGFPTCKSALSKENRHFQKYRIRRNVVYDLSSRPFFCSENCFQEFLHVRKQLREEPLWITGDGSSRKVEFLAESKEKTDYIGVRVEFPDSLISSMRDLSLKSKPESATHTKKKLIAPLKSAVVLLSPDSSVQGNETTSGNDPKISGQQPVIVPVPETGVSAEKVQEEKLAKIRAKYFQNSKRKKADARTFKPLTTLVEPKRLKPVQVKENLRAESSMVEEEIDHEKSIEEIDNSEDQNLEVMATNFEGKSEDLKRIEEILKEWVTDKTLRWLGVVSNLPNKEENNVKEAPREKTEFEEKVDAFFKGEKSQKKPSANSTNPNVPLIDSQDQVRMRRKIASDRIKKMWASSLDFLEISIDGSLLKELIESFDLTADNVALRPKEWKMVAVIVMFLMVEKDRNIADRFQLTGASELQTFLNSLSCNIEYCSNFLANVILPARNNL